MWRTVPPPGAGLCYSYRYTRCANLSADANWGDRAQRSSLRFRCVRPYPSVYSLIKYHQHLCVGDLLAGLVQPQGNGFRRHQMVRQSLQCWCMDISFNQKIVAEKIFSSPMPGVIRIIALATPRSSKSSICRMASWKGSPKRAGRILP